MNELSIIQNVGSIVYDFDALDAETESYKVAYENVVFTEDKKKEAKDTVAMLRKKKKEIEDMVKEVKKEWMKPFEVFANRAFESEKKLDVPICAINEQIDAFEESRKKEKDARVREIFGEMIDEPEILQFLPLEKVYNDKWLNTTYTEKQIKDDIFNAKQNVINSVGVIQNFHSDVEDKAIAKFKETLNLTDAIKVIQDYEESKKVFKAKVETEARQEVVESFIPVETGEKPRKILYTITLTNDAKAKLEAFMDSVGIEYREE